MIRYRPRWRSDAGAYVLTYAGQWAGDHTWADRAALEDVVRQMPNGAHIEIEEAS